MLYIIRHGITDWNVMYKLQGGTDIPLNEEGRKMALEAGERYKDIHFDICYCSPLCRARETAKLLLLGRNIPIIVDERLHEMRFGECEGMDHIMKNPESPMYNFFADPVNYVPGKDGETFSQLYERTGQFIHEVVMPQLEQGRDIIIVGHGAMNNSIINQVKGIELENFWESKINNCELIRIV